MLDVPEAASLSLPSFLTQVGQVLTEVLRHRYESYSSPLTRERGAIMTDRCFVSIRVPHNPMTSEDIYKAAIEESAGTVGVALSWVAFAQLRIVRLLKKSTTGGCTRKHPSSVGPSTFEFWQHYSQFSTSSSFRCSSVRCSHLLDSPLVTHNRTQVRL